MKITTLSKREDYKSIILKSLLKYLGNQNDKLDNIEMTRYYINKRLSIIYSDNTPDHLFYKSIAEYSYNINSIKRIFNILYVKLTSIKFLRKLFSDDFIYLPTFFSNFAIIGGNHRIRILNFANSEFLVLLKNGESSQFIFNELKVRSMPQVNYLPSIKHELNNSWFYETYESGIPFNRINLGKEKKIKHFNNLFHIHNTNLILPTKEKVNIKIYLQNIQTEIINFIKKGNFPLELLPITYQLFSDLDKYFQNSNFEIITSITHGDFQEGNLRIQENKIIVIDWESSDRRFFLYDFFVLLGNPRHEKYLLNSYTTFKEQIYLIDNFPCEFINENSMLLFFLEELKFYTLEENSKNYITLPNRCKDIIIQFISILSLLDFNRNQEL